MKIRSTFILVTVLFSTSGSSQEQDLVAEGAELTLVSNNFKFTEGPAADSLGNIYFTDQPNNRILKWSVEDGKISTFMEDAGRANGLYFDKDGNLLACADEHSEIWRIDENKKVTVLVSGYEGKRLNGPNDLWVDDKGGIYFTDPFYQRDYWNHTGQPIEKQRIYYFNGKEIKIAAEDLDKPNGIIGTPDGKTLYVADIGDDKTWSFPIREDGSLGEKILLTEMGSDGMTIDERGNIYLTGDGVTVFDETGKKILHIPVDRNWTANVTFGGRENKTLFITAMDSLFSLEMKVKGN